ncbi:MAG: hypothetical protein ATN32_00130 [Candidatus Epulonipiscium fishelsonii]|nr:MAG: hypothetical protein ATN32_00130 [Epulopiscium sp. AS2M-Bin002]
MERKNLDPYKVAAGIRRRVLEQALRSGGCNISQACSGSEILATLYTRAMNITDVETPIDPVYFPGPPNATNKGITGAKYNGERRPDLDRFYLSPSQYSVVLYATLVATGRLSEEGFKKFGKDGYVIEHIGEAHSPGLDINGGSLGQAMGMAAGIAMARKLKGETGRNIVLLGDGECQLGMTWEVIQAMCLKKLNNMVVIVDQNRQQCDGKMTFVCDMEHTLRDRFEAFGCEVYEVDGHNCEVLEAIINQSPNKDGKPRVVLAQTNAVYQVPPLLDKGHRIHYVRIDPDEIEKYEALIEKFKEMEK